MRPNARLTRFLVIATLLAVGSVGAEIARRDRRAPGPDAAARPSTGPAPSTTAAASLSRTPVTHVSVRGLDVESGTIQGTTLWGYTELAVDLQTTHLEIASDPHGTMLERLLPASALAIVNGGYFDAGYKPTAWLRSGGVDLAPKVDLGKGGVLTVRGARVFIGHAGDEPFVPEFALQSFPLIVDPDGSPGIHRDDGRRAARTVACLRGGALRLIVISAPRGEGPTLFEAARIFHEPPPAGFGCGVALNFDGGPSSGVCFGKSVPARTRAPMAPVANGVVVMPI